MTLSFIDWERNGVLYSEPDGPDTLGEGTRLLRQLIADALAMGKNRIILNLGEVVYIDSSGLGELVGGYTTVANAGGHLKLVKLSTRTEELMQLTKLHTDLRSMPTKTRLWQPLPASAVAAAGPGAAVGVAL